MSVVFDASALISFLRDEPGAEDVQILLEDEMRSKYVHALNLCEVYYDFFRTAGEHSAESAIGELLAIGIRERNDLDSEFWHEVARVKVMHRRVSLADCCALTLARRLNSTLVTADRHEFERLVGVDRERRPR